MALSCFPAPAAPRTRSPQAISFFILLLQLVARRLLAAYPVCVGLSFVGCPAWMCCLTVFWSACNKFIPWDFSAWLISCLRAFNKVLFLLDVLLSPPSLRCCFPALPPPFPVPLSLAVVCGTAFVTGSGAYLEALQ